MSDQPLSSQLGSIQRILAAYRSTESHITEADITDAWAEFDALRAEMHQAGSVAGIGEVTDIGPDDEWPRAVSNGLDLACSDCGALPQFDYRVDNEFWREHVPEKPARLGVVCLPCLDRRCGGDGLARALREVQWVGTGHTVVMCPDAKYRWMDNDKPAKEPPGDSRE